MKPFILACITFSLAIAASGQGFVRFANRVPDGSLGALLAPVHGVNPAAPGVRLSGNAITNGGSVDYTGVPLLLGTNFLASLWAAPANSGVVPEDFLLVSVTTFLDNPFLAGIWRGSVPFALIPWITEPGTDVHLQVRVWDSRGGAVPTWAAALADPTVPSGYSDPFIYQPTIAPNLPPPMHGLQSFNLVVVPEPSSIALGALGLGAGLAAWMRRRRQPKL